MKSNQPSQNPNQIKSNHASRKSSSNQIKSNRDLIWKSNQIIGEFSNDSYLTNMVSGGGNEVRNRRNSTRGDDSVCQNVLIRTKHILIDHDIFQISPESKSNHTGQKFKSNQISPPKIQTKSNQITPPENRRQIMI